MDVLKDGWFSEFSQMWAGQAFSIKVKKVLYHGRSKFQDILVLDTESYGKALILDGVIQCTERDEFAYQEMMTFVPLCCHENPESVLIIGGGDGGVAREVAKFPSVKKIVQCEIDELVVQVSKQYLPFTATGFDSPKLTLEFKDGLELMRNHCNEFDVIITDSSDPIGPAEVLFGEEYYRLVKKALKPNGIVCSQGENMWYHMDIISKMVTFCQKIFPKVSYGYTCVPTYPGGQIGLLLCGKDPNVDFEKPKKVLTQDDLSSLNLRYYTHEMHKSAFQLPNFAQQQLPKRYE